MKILASVLVLAALLTSCSKTTNSSNSIHPISETEILQTEIRNSQIVLEIQEDAKGMWDVVGKKLFFRLYENGIIEFEYADDKKKIAGKINKAEEINSLKQTKISEEELEKFLILLNSNNFKEVKENYKRKCCCTDATLTYKINLRDDNNQKSITLDNYCSLGELKNSQTRNISDIPKVLSDLIILVDNSRWKYISR